MYDASSSSQYSKQGSSRYTGSVSKQESNTYSKDYVGDRIHSKVVGVSFDNRQEVIKTLRAGQRLDLVREPHNKHDKWAIAVYRSGSSIGYIKKELAAKLAPLMDSGVEFDCVVSEVTGGEPYYRGVNILTTRRGSSAGSTVYKRSYSQRSYSDSYYDCPEYYDPRIYDEYDCDDYPPPEGHPDACCGYDH